MAAQGRPSSRAARQSSQGRLARIRLSKIFHTQYGSRANQAMNPSMISRADQT